ncbi:MAG: hypothetical protein Q9225_003271 [Loekoesia sp. 1 TL-2023]
MREGSTDDWLLERFSHCITRVGIYTANGTLPYRRSPDMRIAGNFRFMTSSHVIRPKDPRGFKVLIELDDTSRDIVPERVYLVAIAAVHDWALEGWEHQFLKADPTFTKRAYSLEIASWSIAPSIQEYQMQTKHLILGILHLIDQMTKLNRFCRVAACLMMEKQGLGFISMAYRVGDSQNNSSSGNTAIKGPPLEDTSHQSLTARRRIVDPSDSDFAIEYEANGDPLTCIDLLSSILYAIATAAQGSNEEFCRDLGGLNEKRSTVYQIQGLRPTASMHLLSYEMVKKGLSLLAPELCDQSINKEVQFSFLYRGDKLGVGAISVSYVAASTAK